MAGLERVIEDLDRQAGDLRDWIRDIENDAWKAVRRTPEGSSDATEETLAWLRRHLDGTESALRRLRGEPDAGPFPGEEAAARGTPPEEI